jgi:hypothetical protein
MGTVVDVHAPSTFYSTCGHVPEDDNTWCEEGNSPPKVASPGWPGFLSRLTERLARLVLVSSASFFFRSSRTCSPAWEDHGREP